MHRNILSSHSKLFKEEALKHGFFGCGISKATFLDTEAKVIEKWLKEGKNAGMHYMSNHFDKRLDPRLLREGTKSIISLIYNYNLDFKVSSKSHYILAKYAYYEDYHFFIKRKMNALVNTLKNRIGCFESSCFIDSAPILERAWATRSGLGYIGKNKHLIVPHTGTYFLICQILTDLEFEYDVPFSENYCKNCRKCLDACPTGAISENNTIDASKCISYLTIEHKDEIPEDLKKKLNKQIFGCDICQKACPHNVSSLINKENSRYLNNEVCGFTKNVWEQLDEKTFKEIFKNSALYRTGLSKLLSNINSCQQ